MAFSWIFGRRSEPVENVVDDETEAPSQQAEQQGERCQDGAINLADIKLSIEDGLLMAFGPLGDPITPQLLKEACARQPQAILRLPNGFAVDHKRLIAVIDAQQGGRLAQQPTDRWIKAMLGTEGSFEQALPERLASEEFEGKSVLAGRLTVDMPDRETITLRDAHPGSARHGSPAKLMIDGKPISIASALSRSGRTDSGNTLLPNQNAILASRGEAITVLLGDHVEARLETASTAWEGEAKVDLFLSDGRQVSVDDLAALLQDMPAPCSPLERRSSGASYPLLGSDEPAFDQERATIVMVSDMPDGWSLTTGMQSERGLWILDPSNLADTIVRVPGSHEGPQSLNIKVISIVGHDGTLEKQTRTVVIPPKGSGDGAKPDTPSPERRDQPSYVVPLILDEAETRLAGRADALLLRGIPEGASLSAGTYDSSIKGWILKPAHLNQLVVRDLDHQAETIEIELTAIHLDQESQSRADVIAKKTMTVEVSS